ncbi:hypothetical protein SISNIDRAFT_471541 [Sistotremastrum niveocremeum HHB9708]|uniref:Cupredoxin n=1 Tax=Sistotremastrum niveocremeum HHB9708 TaxID=1314777 RepID=A0A164MHX9_9AGAM|nr:hypothetical protein SISNIDRAFT_471541 [Sistotremastrum niveocremeum HHB9708]
MTKDGYIRVKVHPWCYCASVGLNGWACAFIGSYEVSISMGRMDWTRLIWGWILLAGLARRVNGAPNIHIVQVGGVQTLTFSPNSIVASNGDIVRFIFDGIGVHSVVQSNFIQPCQPFAGGFNSGFVNVSAGFNGSFLQYDLEVVDETTPVWSQPHPHCVAGMSGVINPSGTAQNLQELEAYQGAARKLQTLPVQSPTLSAIGGNGGAKATASPTPGTSSVSPSSASTTVTVHSTSTTTSVTTTTSSSAERTTTITTTSSSLTSPTTSPSAASSEASSSSTSTTTSTSAPAASSSSAARTLRGRGSLLVMIFWALWL